MVMFLLSFVKGVQIRGGESISASGYGPRGSKSAGTPGTISNRLNAQQLEIFTEMPLKSSLKQIFVWKCQAFPNINF